MRGTKIAIRLEHAEIDGDAGVIHVDALDAVQALYEAGVPDIFLPAPRGGYAGLFIEMKRRKNGRVSIDQAT